MPTPFDTRSSRKTIGCKHTTRVYAPGAALFSEGQVPQGIFILGSGRVKLFSSTAEGRVFITKIARASEMLGLNAVVLGEPYLVSAEVVEPSTIHFVERDTFLRYLETSPQAAREAIEQLSSNYYDSQRDLRALGLSHTAREKLARLLLEWVRSAEVGEEDEIWLRLFLTHEEIAQMIGSSRETVTRLFGEFSRKKIIQVQEEALLVRDLPALRRIARDR